MPSLVPMVWGLGFRVLGLEFTVQGTGLRSWGGGLSV